MNNKDVQIAHYFIPQNLKHIKVSALDKLQYIEWSSEGKHTDKIKKSHFDDGFNALVYGKRRAGLHMSLWEQGVLDGTMPYYTLLGGFTGKKRNKIVSFLFGFSLYTHNPLPRFIVDFMKKEMFKGNDSPVIEKVYQQIIREQKEHNYNYLQGLFQAIKRWITT